MTELDIIIVLFCIIQTFYAILLTDLCYVVLTVL